VKIPEKPYSAISFIYCVVSLVNPSFKKIENPNISFLLLARKISVS
jgi:hypothetical protein